MTVWKPGLWGAAAARKAWARARLVCLTHGSSLLALTRACTVHAVRVFETQSFLLFAQWPQARLEAALVKPEFGAGEPGVPGGRGLMPEFGAILTAKLTQTTPYVGPRVLDGHADDQAVLMAKLIFPGVTGADFLEYRDKMAMRTTFYLSCAWTVLATET